MRFFEKTKGAISLFLVIILVPMLTLSGLFVDASKVNLGKAMAESAGDLTLNTALTNYDTQLKELYGLMATAQNTDDLFGKLEEYYRTCITSSGVSEEDAVTYVEQIMAQLGVVSESNDTADIMNMQLVDFSVEKYPDANLANATILEKQIVEFMKYRAPINTGLSFLSSLKSFSTLSKQTELVEKKQAYYKEQQGVMENLKSAWQEIANYNNTNIVKEAEYMSNILSSLGDMENNVHGYKTLHSYLVKDLYHVDSYVNYSVSVNGSNKAYTLVWGGQNKGTIKKSKELPVAGDLQDAVDHLKGAIEAAETTRESRGWERATTDYELQYVVQALRNDNKPLEKYTQQMIEVHSWYMTLDGLYTNLDEYDKRIEEKEAEKAAAVGEKEAAEAELEELQDSEEADESDITALKNKISNLGTTISDLETEISGMTTTQEMLDTSITVDGVQKSIKDWFNSIASLYDSEMQKFSPIATRMSQYAVNAKTKHTTNKEFTTTSVSSIATEINGYVEELQSSSDYLELAIKYLEAARKELAAGGKVAEAKKAWDGVADDESIKGTNLAKQDKAEIAQLDTYLTETNVNKLKTRLENIKTEIDKSIEQIKNYKYCGKFIGDIDTYTKLENAIDGKIGKTALESVPINESELDAKVTAWWTTCWQDGGLKFDWMKQSGKQPDLTKDKCAMYSYLYSHFAAIVTAENVAEKADGKNATTATATAKEDEPNGKTFYDDLKKNSSEEASEKAKDVGEAQASKGTKGNNIAELENLPSSREGLDDKKTPSGSKDVNTDSAASSASSALGSLFDKSFLDAIASMATDLRDKLYVSDYAMSMFSYDTIENEYKVKKGMAKDAAVPAGTLLTLTKNDLSAKNNYAYGAEVEYIIYGGKNSENLTSTYGTIYGIRFGFNLIYAFATSEIRESALAIATPVSAATLGVIPVPLIQAAIIIALACCESAVDLVDIRAGHQIPLYKSQKTWVCSVTGLTKKAKDAAQKVIREHANALVDKGVDKLNDILDMTDEEVTKLLENGKTDVLESVSTAYDQLITENANLAIQTLTTLVTDAIESTRCLSLEETYEQKKEEALGKAIDELKIWRDAQTGSDIASVVKREAVNVIIANDGKLVKELFAQMETSIQSSKPGDTIDNILNNAEEKAIGEISKLGGEIMTKIEDIRVRIQNQINKSCDEVIKFKTEGIDSVKNALASNAEDLKKNLNDAIDGCLDDICGSDGAGGDEGVSTAGLCSFAYSDYLRLFTLIGLYVNEEKVVLRIGDVIQANLINGPTKKNGYQLKMAATYVKVSAEVQVKPTFLALPLFADVENNPNTDTGWYTIKYNGMAGY